MKLIERSSVNTGLLFFIGGMSSRIRYHVVLLFALSLFFSSCGTKQQENAEKSKVDTASGAPTPIDQLTERIKTDPNNPELYVLRSQYYMAEKKFTPASPATARANNVLPVLGLAAMIFTVPLRKPPPIA